MTKLWQETLWHQFGAAIETLENVLNACPDELWHAQLWRMSDGAPESAEFWYILYHTIFWLDYYSSALADTFSAPPPFYRHRTGYGRSHAAARLYPAGAPDLSRLCALQVPRPNRESGGRIRTPARARQLARQDRRRIAPLQHASCSRTRRALEHAPRTARRLCAGLGRTGHASVAV